MCTRRAREPSSSTAGSQCLLQPGHRGSSTLFSDAAPGRGPGGACGGDDEGRGGPRTPRFYYKLRKLSLLNYLHALFDKN